jgi:hypothetical protein
MKSLLAAKYVVFAEGKQGERLFAFEFAQELHVR